MPSTQPSVDDLVAAVAGKAVPARLQQSPLLPVLRLSSWTRWWGWTCWALSRWVTQGSTKYQNISFHFQTLGYHKPLLLFGMVYSNNGNWQIYSGFPDLHDFHFQHISQAAGSITFLGSLGIGIRFSGLSILVCKLEPLSFIWLVHCVIKLG